MATIKTPENIMEAAVLQANNLQANQPEMVDVDYIDILKLAMQAQLGYILSDLNDTIDIKDMC